MNISYFAEINLPSKNAYSIHVMKMCEALSYKDKVTLYTFKKKKINLHKIYNCKNNFKIKAFNLNKINFINRLKFCIKLLKIFNKKKYAFKNNLIISRSVLSGIFMSFFNYKVILEIHHELTGFTNLIFKMTKWMPFFKKIKFIFISKNLSKKFALNNSYIILDDAVNIEDFKIKIKRSLIKKKTCVYTGSLAPGKGLENIIEISKILKNINFDIYGDFLNSNFKETDLKKYPNIKFMGHVEYRKIPNILNQYNIVLMPYSKKVYVRAKNIETSKYMSPMKLFDYMASKKIIIASKLNVYSHILNEKNSILIKKHSIKLWVKKIDYVFKNYVRLGYLKRNAFQTVKNYTWNKRVEKILKFLNV